MKNILIGIANRFKEPSSYAGLAVIFTGLGLNIGIEYIEAVSYILAGIAGVVSIVLKEKK